MYRVQKRLAFYVHDGYGIGHLQRVCKLVAALQGVFSCLVLTGSRHASWAVPLNAEFIHLPAFDGLIASRAKARGIAPFVRMKEKEALILRQRLIQGALEAFEPDAIIVEHRPLGDHDELELVLGKIPCRKYLLLRGVLDSLENVQSKFMIGPAGTAMEQTYDRILIASDRRIFDLAREYGFSKAVAEKLLYVGYVGPQIEGVRRAAIRKKRGLSESTVWVVCSIGGGRSGGQIIDCCRELQGQFPDVVFDFIYGPNTTSGAWAERESDTVSEGQSRSHRFCKQLSSFHASADVVVSHGGYNSLTEAASGGARIVTCFFIEHPESANLIEELIHPQKLNAIYPLRIVTSKKDFQKTIEEEIGAAMHEDRNARKALSCEGSKGIRQVLMDDLDVIPEFVQLMDLSRSMDAKTAEGKKQTQSLRTRVEHEAISRMEAETR